jgi:predicted ferric reductase
MRFLSYKTFRIRNHNSQSLGAYMLLTVGIIFFSAMTLGPRPYYWPTDAHYGNSPPIATRTGWMALACLPFVLLLSAKANMITALTGIPHEKLNIWHNWVSWAMFVLALIHTFPFVIFRTWKGDVYKEFTKGGIWLTGVIALIAQTWLTGMSISWIRYVFGCPLSSLNSSSIPLKTTSILTAPPSETASTNSSKQPTSSSPSSSSSSSSCTAASS